MMEVHSEDEGGRQGYLGMNERLQQGTSPPREQHPAHVVEADEGGGQEMKERLYQLGTSPPKEQHLAHKVEGLIDFMGLQEGITPPFRKELLPKSIQTKGETEPHIGIKEVLHPLSEPSKSE